MSRVGNRPIKINDGVDVEIKADTVILSSQKGELTIATPETITVEKDDGAILVRRKRDDKFSRSQHGLIARLIQNGIEGLSNGIKRTLEFKGTGYRAKTEGGKVIMSMGYSHETILDIPSDVDVVVAKNIINISGYDAAVVGNFAAKIREVRPPEVYKGKGIKYIDEEIKKKDGKVASGGKG